MYIKSIHMEGYGPIEELTISFTSEDENYVPTVLFGLQGSGKSFILNKLYQIVQQWHRQFYREIVKEYALETDEQKAQCYNETLINIVKNYLHIESYLIAEGQEKAYRVVFRRKDSEIPLDILGNFHTSSSLGRDELYIDFNGFMSKNRSQSQSNLRPFQEAHEEHIYLYFPSSRINRNPWGYLHDDGFFSPKYPTIGSSDKSIIQNNCYGDVVVWLQHIIFQHYRIRAENINDDHSILIEFSLEKLQTLLVDLLKEQFPNHKVGLSFDSGHRRIYIDLLDQRTNIKRSIPLESLSESQLSLFVMFALILKHCEKQKIQPEALEGVILIDNAEQGLDSTTQLVYFPRIIQQFPKVQFIFSTSSIYILEGLKQQFENNFNCVDLSKPEPFLDIKNMNLQGMFSALEERMKAEVKLKLCDENQDKQEVESESPQPVFMLDDGFMIDEGTSEGIIPQDQFTEIATVKQDSNDPEIAEREAYLKTIQLIQKNNIFPENFKWENVPMFSVIAGKNGVGKTQFLKILADQIRNLNNQFKAPRRGGKNGESSETQEYQDIHVLYYGCATEINVSLDDNNRFNNFIQSISNAADKYYKIYYRIRMVTDDEALLQNELDQLTEPEKHHYEKTILLFENNKQRFDAEAKQPHNYDQSIKQSFDLCVRKTAGLPIFLAAYPEKLISYLLDLMFPHDLIHLNEMLQRFNFKYRINKTRDDFRFNHSNENFELTNANLGLRFSSLSPGEKLELMTLIWLYDANLMHRDQPALLLLDEPDAHLHPSLTYDVVERIKNRLVAEYGVQVIMTTHNPVTISQLAGSEHLFIMTRENATQEPQIIKATTKREVSQHLIAYSTCVNQSMRFVFVEADDDVRFYQIVYRKMLTSNMGNALVAPLFFKAHGQKKQTVPDKKSSQKGKEKEIESDHDEIGDNSSCGLVKRLVEKFVPDDEDDNTLKDFMYGIVDGDNQNQDELPQNVMALQRYSIENYLCDPLQVFYMLMERRSKNKNYIKLKNAIESLLKENDIELPSTFVQLRELPLNFQSQIAQTILDQMIRFLFEILMNNGNDEYVHIINTMSKERFKLYRNDSSFDDTKIPVKFIQGFELEYPVFFIKMQGHKLEGLYNTLFGTSDKTGFAGKKDFLKFFEENDILLPEELCNIITKISCGTNENAADRRAELRRIKEKEQAFDEIPLMQKESEQRKRKLNEAQNALNKSKSENKKLKTDKSQLERDSKANEMIIAKFEQNAVLMKPLARDLDLHAKTVFFKIRCKKLYDSKDDPEKFSRRHAKAKLAFNKLEELVKNSSSEQEQRTGTAALAKAAESCENFIKKGFIQESETDKIFWR